MSFEIDTCWVVGKETCGTILYTCKKGYGGGRPDSSFSFANAAKFKSKRDAEAWKQEVELGDEWKASEHGSAI